MKGLITIETDLEEIFEAYIAEICGGRENITAKEFLSKKQSFYCGVLNTLNMLHDIADLSDDEGKIVLQSWQDECAKFLRKE